MTPSKIGFLDTLCLHAAVGGLSTQQRAKWQKYQKEKQVAVTEKKDEEEDDDEQPLISLENEDPSFASPSSSSKSKSSKPKSSKKESHLKPPTPLTDLQKDAIDFYNNFTLDSAGSAPSTTRRWEEMGAINSLDRVAALHLGVEEAGVLDKSVRKEFEEERVERLAAKFQELVDYCANDVVCFWLSCTLYTPSLLHSICLHVGGDF